MEAKPEVKADGENISLVVQDAAGGTVHFKIKKSTPFRYLH